LTHLSTKITYPFEQYTQKGKRGMIMMEDWVTIRNLKKKNPNIGTRELARILGIGRSTVKKSLKSDVLPLYNGGEKKINEAVATPVALWIWRSESFMLQ